eukprot:INCI2682.6.p1 GENE.INCI2682.6~~INCI2682.6.p1  ORF type:complete len:1303 (+),score=233.18 INCI2682.6:293-4201(+)
MSDSIATSMEAAAGDLEVASVIEARLNARSRREAAKKQRSAKGQLQGMHTYFNLSAHVRGCQQATVSAGAWVRPGGERSAEPTRGRSGKSASEAQSAGDHDPIAALLEVTAAAAAAAAASLCDEHTTARSNRSLDKAALPMLPCESIEAPNVMKAGLVNEHTETPVAASPVLPRGSIEGPDVMKAGRASERIDEPAAALPASPCESIEGLTVMKAGRAAEQTEAPAAARPVPPRESIEGLTVMKAGRAAEHTEAPIALLPVPRRESIGPDVMKAGRANENAEAPVAALPVPPREPIEAPDVMKAGRAKKHTEGPVVAAAAVNVSQSHPASAPSALVLQSNSPKEVDFGETDSDSEGSANIANNEAANSVNRRDGNGVYDTNRQPVYFNEDSNDDDDDRSVDSDGSVFGEDGVLVVAATDSSAADALSRTGVYERVEPKDTDGESGNRLSGGRPARSKRVSAASNGGDPKRPRVQLNLQSSGDGGVLGAEGKLSIKDHRLLADLVRGRRHAHLSLEERLKLQIVARAIQNKHNSEDVQICWDNIAAFDSARTCLHEGACAPTAACMAFSPLQGPTVNHRKVCIQRPDAGQLPNYRAPQLLLDHGRLAAMLNEQPAPSGNVLPTASAATSSDLLFHGSMPGCTAGEAQREVLLWDDPVVARILSALSDTQSATPSATVGHTDRTTDSVNASDEEEPYHPEGFDAVLQENEQSESPALPAQTVRPIRIRAVLSESALSYFLAASADDDVCVDGFAEGAITAKEPDICVVERPVHMPRQHTFSHRVAPSIPHLHASWCGTENVNLDQGSVAARTASESRLTRHLSSAVEHLSTSKGPRSGTAVSYQYNVWRIGKLDVLVRCHERPVVLHRIPAATDCAQPGAATVDTGSSVESWRASTVDLKLDPLVSCRGRQETIARREVVKWWTSMWCRNVDSITVARIAAKPLAESAADRVSPEEWSVSEWQHWSSVELLNLGCPPLQPAVEETVLISEVEATTCVLDEHQSQVDDGVLWTEDQRFEQPFNPLPQFRLIEDFVALACRRAWLRSHSSGAASSQDWCRYVCRRCSAKSPSTLTWQLQFVERFSESNPVLRTVPSDTTRPPPQSYQASQWRPLCPGHSLLFSPKPHLRFCEEFAFKLSCGDQVRGLCKKVHVAPIFSQPVFKGKKANAKPISLEQRFLWRSMASTQPSSASLLHSPSASAVLATNDIEIHAAVRNCHDFALSSWRNAVDSLGLGFYFLAEPMQQLAGRHCNATADGHCCFVVTAGSGSVHFRCVPPDVSARASRAGNKCTETRIKASCKFAHRTM